MQLEKVLKLCKNVEKGSKTTQSVIWWVVEIILGLRNPTSNLRTTIGRLEYCRGGLIINATSPSSLFISYISIH